MSDVEKIGERIYRKVVTPVYSDDRRYYTCGCVIRDGAGGVKVIFLKYEYGKGIIGRCRPSAELGGVLREYGAEFKRYVNQMDRDRANDADRVINRVDKIPTRGIGSEKKKKDKSSKRQR